VATSTKLTIGYGRASSDDQSTDIQDAQLKAAGCSVVLTENASGSKREGREKLNLALQMLKAHPGSTLVVCRLDRLSRSLKDAIAIHEELVAAGASLKVLDMGLDTSTAHGLFFYHLLQAMSQWETTLRRERQALGIAKAKANGVYKGASPKLTPEQAKELRERHAAKVSLSVLSREYGISRASTCRYLKRG
jgi:DNA invertase Pin-like site-specific DNA recombinase